MIKEKDEIENKMSQSDSLKNLDCKVVNDYFLGVEVKRDIDLDIMTQKVNQLLKEEYGEEYKVVECHHYEEFIIIDEYYVLETNLPYNLFSLKENDSIPQYMLNRDGWLCKRFLKILVDELLFNNNCLNTGNYKNRYGLDSEEVKNFFKEYENYIEELYENSIPRKYGIYKLWEEFYIDEENLGDFYEICRSNKKNCPFTRIRTNSFSND